MPQHVRTHYVHAVNICPCTDSRFGLFYLSEVLPKIPFVGHLKYKNILPNTEGVKMEPDNRQMRRNVSKKSSSVAYIRIYQPYIIKLYLLAYRVVHSDCSKHSEDVGMLELPHDGSLLEELGSVFLAGPFFHHFNSHLQRTIQGVPCASVHFTKCTRSKTLFGSTEVCMKGRGRTDETMHSCMHVDELGERKNWRKPIMSS